MTVPVTLLKAHSLTQTTNAVQLNNTDLTITLADGTGFTELPTAVLVSSLSLSETISIDSLVSGSTFNITRAIEPGQAAQTFAAGSTVKIIAAAETIRRMQNAFTQRTKGEINVFEYGAVGDGRPSSGTITVGSQTLVLDTASFTAADVGKSIVIQGAGTAGGTLVTTISAFTNSTTVTLTAAAATTSNSGALIWGTDDTVAIQAAINSISTGRGGRVTLPPAVYCISGTILVGSHVELWGNSSGQGLPRLPNDAEWHSGSCLVWVGATNGTMVKVFDSYGTIVHGITVNAENVAGVTGFRLDSTGGGTGASQVNTFEHINMWHCAVAFQWGPPYVYGVALGEQADTTVIRRFHIAAPTIASTAQGIVVNTVNSQISKIEQGIIQSVNKGILYQHCGMINSIDRVTFGGLVTGTNPTCIQASPVGGELLIMNCQAEGVTYFLRALDRIMDGDPGGLASLAAITMITCHLDTPILITGANTVVCIGATASVGTGGTSYTSNGNVISIGDDLNNTWVITGSGTLTELGSTLGGSAAFHWRFPQFELANALGTPAIWKKHLTATATPTMTLIASGASANYSIPCTGARIGEMATATIADGTALQSGLSWNATILVNDTVTLRITNSSAGGLTPTTALWRATVLGY